MKLKFIVFAVSLNLLSLVFGDYKTSKKEVFLNEGIKDTIISLDQSISSFSIEFLKGDLSDIRVFSTKTKSYDLFRSEIENKTSLVLTEGLDSFLVFQTFAEVHFIIHSIYVSSLEPVFHRPLEKMSCDQLSAISFTTWRDGLPLPKPGRLKTEVHHLIVHHSAGSNTYTNYTDAVRNIYIYHTESNGWDDIGYNYLIAQDGTIFLGRDPQGVAEQFEIQGAHFCGKNSNTIGVCLLGNYELIEPPTVMMSALFDLLTYNVLKNDLDVFEEQIHYEGVAGKELLTPTITGHKFGCGVGYTDCPGKNVYNKLNVIRDSVSVRLAKCKTLGIDDAFFVKEKRKLTYRILNGSFYITSIEGNLEDIVFYHLNGEVVKNEKNNNNYNFVDGGIFVFYYVISGVSYSELIYIEK